MISKWEYHMEDADANLTHAKTDFEDEIKMHQGTLEAKKALLVDCPTEEVEMVKREIRESEIHIENCEKIASQLTKTVEKAQKAIHDLIRANYVIATENPAPFVPTTINRFMTLRTFMDAYEKHELDVTQERDSIWQGWDCETRELSGRGQSLADVFYKLIKSSQLNVDNCRVWFSNRQPNYNFPMSFDEIIISDFSGDTVLYKITYNGIYEKIKNPSNESPERGWQITTGGAANVLSAINNFNEPVVHGTWQDVVDYFTQNT